jgi:hypothetical protein
MGRKGIPIEQCEEAIRKAGGFISHAAAMLGISHQSLSKRISRSDRLQQVRAETTDQHLDLAETKLIEAVKAGEAWAICFYLKCKGKHRGYVERGQVEVSGRYGKPLGTPDEIRVVFVEPKPRPELDEPKS